MPVDKQVLLRYQVLNRCFRNRFREFTIDDLVEACNEALRKADKPDVSKRTIQNDINILEADYGIQLNENLKRGRQRLYRYRDTDYTLPLFRIDDFKELSLPYKEAGVDFSEYFDDVIGVTVPDDAPEDIIIKVSKQRFNYIKTKPLHLSQHIVDDTAADHTVIKINVKINKELESLILSFGPDMEVLAPADLRQRIAEKAKAMNEKYSDV